MPQKSLSPSFPHRSEWLCPCLSPVFYDTSFGGLFMNTLEHQVDANYKTLLKN